MKTSPPTISASRRLSRTSAISRSELKELENTLLTARERIAELEYRSSARCASSSRARSTACKAAADAVARLDALCSLAEVAVRNNYYVCPEVDTLDARSTSARGGTPSLSRRTRTVLFVPNDTFLNDADDRVAIVTGPNMAGKSTYMRQTALIVLMAQMGSFVPAKERRHRRGRPRVHAHRRVGRPGLRPVHLHGRDERDGQHPQPRDGASLLILDEIGRGTSTFDGMAIARAVLEYCADKRRLGAKTMFATHYHELTALEGELGGVSNYNITAKKQGGTLVFLRKIVRGAADDSYGIEVAKLAGCLTAS